MRSFVKTYPYLPGLLLWGLAVLGILKAGPLVDSLLGAEYSICGVWGCGPPLSSLLVWNTFVAVLLIPPVAWTAFRFPAAAEKYGRLVLWAGLAAAIIFIASDTAAWWRTASETARKFLFRRALFSTVAFTDAPVLPGIAAVLCFYAIGRKQRTVVADDSLANSAQTSLSSGGQR